ncbi:MAG: hypothetical protein J5585_00965 [Clostridia bacterium]|nr:hypothetical protein [Clostridia bacterium]
MKKILAVATVIAMTAALFAVCSVAADPAVVITAEQLSAAESTYNGVTVELSTEGGVDFARFTAGGLDPHLYIKPDIKTDASNHFAAIKYRTTSGAASIDAYMAAAEPHTIFSAIEADGSWHIAYGDLEQSGANWTGTFARLDPMNGGSLKEGDTLDVAWIALFASEDDAKAYTGPAAGGDTPVAPSTDKSDDQWLCGGDPAAKSTGWWMNPINGPDEKYIKVNFTANGYFDGVKGYYLCNPASAEVGQTVVKVQLLDASGSVLEEKEIPVDGDQWYETNFDRSYAAGTYSLNYVAVSGNGGWFVFGSADADDSTVTLESNCATNGDTKSHPIVMLMGADAPAEGGEPTPTNPGTADASVIAIAAVACIALAGVVVAKKVR